MCTVNSLAAYWLCLFRNSSCRTVLIACLVCWSLDSSSAHAASPSGLNFQLDAPPDITIQIKRTQACDTLFNMPAASVSYAGSCPTAITFTTSSIFTSLNTNGGLMYFPTGVYKVVYTVTDHCGSCRACIDACPTQAIVSDRIVDGSKCISYATIELKNEIPDYFNGKMDDWMFGCDVCQDVCPWNRFSAPTLQEKFAPNFQKLNFRKNEWKELTQELFSEIFKKSAVKRTKFSGLMRNINLLNDHSL